MVHILWIQADLPSLPGKSPVTLPWISVAEPKEIDGYLQLTLPTKGLMTCANRDDRSP